MVLYAMLRITSLLSYLLENIGHIAKQQDFSIECFQPNSMGNNLL